MISGLTGFRISGEEERDCCRISTKNRELLCSGDYCPGSKIYCLLSLIQQQKGKGNFLQFFFINRP
ncbi:hypothetical protein CF032_26670 [Klebsiella oxytoca]|nr:hypothetical protein [Klebsiella oxytoca]